MILTTQRDYSPPILLNDLLFLTEAHCGLCEVRSVSSYARHSPYRVSASFTAMKAWIRRDIPWQLRCSGQRQKKAVSWQAFSSELITNFYHC
jgi:hypothetical protein